MKPRYLAVLAIAFVFAALLGSCAKALGQQPTSVGPGGLPTVAPFGSIQKIKDSAVTNRYTAIIMTLYFRESPEAPFYYRAQNSPVRQFTSYDDFKLYVRTNGWYLRNWIASWAEPPSESAEAMLKMAVLFSQPTNGAYYDLTGATEQYTMSVSNYFGLFRDLTPSSFDNLAEPTKLRSVTWFENLSDLRLSADLPTGAYTNYWSGLSQSWTYAQQEYNSPEVIVGKALILDQKYGSGSNRCRVEFRNGGNVSAFTQDGVRNTPSFLQMLDKSKVRLSFAAGSDVTVESAQHANGPWTVYTNFPWSLHSSEITFSTGPSRNFYRASTR